MAKKATIKKAAPAETKPAPRKRISGKETVRFVSNGLSRYMRKVGKIHTVTADHAQLLADKGYGVIVQEDIDRLTNA